MTKRILSAAMAAAMLVSMAACSSGASSTAPASSKAPASSAAPAASSSAAPASSEAPAEREVLEISAYYPLHPSAATEDIPEQGWLLDRMYEEKFAVEFDWYEVPATNESETYNITIASGDIPDLVFQNSWTALNNYKDAWWVLDDFVATGKYPYFKQYQYDDPYNYALSANNDGQVQVFSQWSSQFVGDGLLIRGDLVEDWGLTIENDMTKEEFADLLRFSKEKDPNIVPYMTRKNLNGMIQRLCEGWSGLRENAVYKEDGTVVWGGAEAGMKDVVTWLNELYKEGLIDTEFPTTDTAAWQEKVLGDNTGVFVTHDNISSRIDWAQKEWAKLGVTDKWYTAITPLSPDGTTKGQTTIHYPRQRCCGAIFTGASEEEVERILEMIDFSYSPEGTELINYGIEGVSFNYAADGSYELIAEYHDAVAAGTYPMEDKISGNMNFIKLEENGIYAISKKDYPNVKISGELYEQGGYIRSDLANAVRYTDEEQDVISKYETDIKTYTNEQLTKFITGITPIDQWDAYIAGFADYHLDEYMAAVNAGAARAQALVGSSKNT